MAADGGGEEWVDWRAAKGAVLAGHVKDKKEEYFDAVRRRGLDQLWNLAFAQAFGTDPLNPRDFATQTLALVGSEGNGVRCRINEPRAYVNQINTIAQGQRPAFQCLTVNRDFGPNASAQIAKTVVTYLYRESMGEEREAEGLESAGWFGSAYFWVRWDKEAGDDVQVQEQVEGLPHPETVTKRSGAPKVQMLFPWEYCREVYAKESSWGIVRELRSKSELCSLYPDLARDISKVNNTGSDQTMVAEMFVYDAKAVNTDHVMVDHFYVKPCKAMPLGRYVALCDGIELWDGACPHPKRIPVAELVPHKFFGTSFGYANIWDVLGIQEAADELVSMCLSNYFAFGRQNVFVEDGTTIDEDALSEGNNVFFFRQDGKPPFALAPAAMPTGVDFMLDFLYKRANTLLGLNETARGQQDETVKSGTHAALYDQIAIRFQSAYMGALHRCREDVANLILDMVKSYAEIPFLVEIAGVDEEPYLKEFTRESVSGVRKVRVAVVSPALESIPGRLEVFMQLSKLPPAQRRGALRALETGDFSGFTEKEKNHDLLVRWENEQLCQGVFIMPGPGENPSDHLPEHFAEYWKQKTSENPNMPALQALQAHINETIKAWQLGDPFTAMFMGIPAPATPGSPQWTAAMMGQPLDAMQVPAVKKAAEEGGAAAAGGGKGSPSMQPMGSDGVPLPEPAEPAGEKKVKSAEKKAA